MKMREYKIRNLMLLAQFEQELPSKYGDEVKEVIQRLVVKTSALRRYNFVDYLTTILLLLNKYPELRALLPSPADADELLKEDDREQL